MIKLMKETQTELNSIQTTPILGPISMKEQQPQITIIL
jgi:hypothetical protein